MNSNKQFDDTREYNLGSKHDVAIRFIGEGEKSS